MDDLSEDCVLGAEFLHRVNPYLVDHTQMNFTCVLNGHPVSLPISFKSVPKCKITKVKPVHTPNIAQLMKMERSKIFSDVHGEKTLKDIAEKLKRDCCSDSPNAFQNREKYFVSLPYDPLQRINPMKASAALMSPSERQFYDTEIK